VSVDKDLVKIMKPHQVILWSFILSFDKKLIDF
jgi:hypothetical protein